MKTEVAIFFIVLIFGMSCRNTKKDYYENGNVKEIKYYTDNNILFKIEYYNRNGVVEAVKKFNTEGVLIIENKKLEGGDSLEIEYCNSGMPYVKEFTSTGEVFNYTLENELKEGVGRLYKDGKLTNKALFYNGEIFAFNDIEYINRNKVVVIQYALNNDTIVNDIFNTHIQLYHRNKDGGFVKDGFYLQGSLNVGKDTIFGSYANLELRDTAYVGEITEGIVRGGALNAQDKFLDFEINVSSPYVDIIDEKIFRSPEGVLIIKFKAVFKREGYNYLSGYAWIKSSDSEWSNRFLVFDDIFIDSQK